MNSFPKNIALVVTATFVGVSVGHGLVSTGSFLADKLSDFKDEQAIVTVDVSKDYGGPPDEVKFVKNESRDFKTRTISYTSKKIGYSKIDKDKSFPNITANKVLIFDLETGEVVEFSDEIPSLEKEIIRNESQPIASISKLMTVLVAWENIDHDEIVNIGWDAVSTYGKQGGLSVGDKLSAMDLIYSLLLTSSNDGAEALAMHYGRSEFMKLMNERAKSIGMENTFYHDPSGLSARNVSSVNDLMRLTLYLERNYPEIFEITRLRDYRTGKFTWYSNSRFRNDDNYIGGKNGYIDEAKNTLVSLFELPIGEDSAPRKVAIIILGSDSAEKDMRSIVLYLLQNIEYVAD